LVSVLYESKSTILGEGPVYCELTKNLYWVDIKGKKLHIMNMENHHHDEKNFNEVVGCVCLTGHLNKVVVALKTGLHLFDLKENLSHSLVSRNDCGDRETNRFNDGKPDPHGRMWIGTMSEDLSNIQAVIGHGALYSFENNKSTLRQPNITVSNGLAWSSDHTKLYYIDSVPGAVYQYDYDINTGNISNRREIIKFPSNSGRDWGLPDGMTIDSEDMLWIAHWGGACISRWNPNNSEMLEVIEVPAYQVTCVCFGGENFDQLYISSARDGLSQDKLEKFPLSGSLFYIPNMKVKGVPPFRAKISN